MIVDLDFERPASDVIRRFRAVRMDAVARLAGNERIADPAIKPVAGLPHIVGPALTVATHGADPRMAILAVGAARAGDVILISGATGEGSGWGGGLTLSADEVRCEAVAIDGLVVDLAAIVSCRTPVYARGVTLRSMAAATLGSIATPILFGGVTVAPGDLVVGDADGLCIVAKANIRTLLIEAEDETARIAANIGLITGTGSTIFDLRGGKTYAESLGLAWPG